MSSAKVDAHEAAEYAVAAYANSEKARELKKKQEQEGLLKRYEDEAQRVEFGDDIALALATAQKRMS